MWEKVNVEMQFNLQTVNFFTVTCPVPFSHDGESEFSEASEATALKFSPQIHPAIPHLGFPHRAFSSPTELNLSVNYKQCLLLRLLVGCRWICEWKPHFASS